jgi:periplasmic copper chaperone A
MYRRSFLLLPFATTSAFAHALKAGDLKIGHAWTLPGHAGSDGQCFMPLLNAGQSDDALVAARSGVCSFIELRMNARYDDAAETQFALAPNKPIAMRPQARHLRLMGLRRDLKVGERFFLVLDFLNAGEVEVEIYVEEKPGD